MKTYGLIQSWTLSAKLFFLLLICFVSASLLSFIGLVAGMAIWSLPFDALEHYTEYGIEGINFIRLNQAAGAVGLFILPSITFPHFLGRPTAEFLQTDNKPKILLLLLLAIYTLLQLPWINVMSAWNNSLEWGGALEELYQAMRAKEDAAAAMIENLLTMPDIQSLLVTMIVVALIPAMGEELLFRGIIQNLFGQRYGIHAGIWITAFIFSFIHFQFFGFFPRLFLGALLGYVFYYTGSLWYAIAVHFTNNAGAVIAYFAFQHGMIGESPDDWGTGEGSVLWVIFSAGIGIAGIMYLQRVKVIPNT
ncbi:MAG: lysostaphin resistance A-like protein [Bacteroidia bacterium]